MILQKERERGKRVRKRDAEKESLREIQTDRERER
jgi:hypothetical protein